VRPKKSFKFTNKRMKKVIDQKKYFLISVLAEKRKYISSLEKELSKLFSSHVLEEEERTCKSRGICGQIYKTKAEIALVNYQLGRKGRRNFK
jgi:uncharacterized protein YqgQ